MDINKSNTQTQRTTITGGSPTGTATFNALVAGAPSSLFNEGLNNANTAPVLFLGQDSIGPNANATTSKNAFSDPDLIAGNADDEQLQIVLGTTAGLSGFGYNFTTGTITISGFSSNPNATNTGGTPTYSAGALTFTETAFNSARTLTLDPAASKGSTLLISTNVNSAAPATAANFSPTTFRFEDALPVPEPTSLAVLGLGATGLLLRLRQTA